MRIVAVMDPDTALGFRLGGIEVISVRSAEEAAPKLLALLRGAESPVLSGVEGSEGEGWAKEAGLVLYADEWLEDLPDDLRGRLERSDLPIFTPVPTLRSWGEKERVRSYMAGLLKRVIGYQIALK